MSSGERGECCSSAWQSSAFSQQHTGSAGTGSPHQSTSLGLHSNAWKSSVTPFLQHGKTISGLLLGLVAFNLFTLEKRLQTHKMDCV